MNDPSLSPAADLEERLAEVRLALRRRHALRALLYFGIGTLAATLLCTAWLMARGPAPADWTLGVAGFLLIEVVLAIALALGVRRSVPSRTQIALFIDEHFPELENLVLSAAEFGASGETAPSTHLVERLLSDPRLSGDTLALGEIFPQRHGRRLAAGVLVFVGLWLGILVLARSAWLPPMAGSGFFGRGGNPLLHVEPGDARVRRGQNQIIVAKVRRAGPVARLRWRSAGEPWVEAEMAPGRAPEVHSFQISDIESPVEYEVRWERISSPVYRLSVWEPPRVEAIDLNYRYPEYLGLPPREVAGGGNIAAVQGTEVDIRVASNKELKRAALVFESGRELPLQREDKTHWVGMLKLERDDRYHVELIDSEDEANPVLRSYDVLARPDAPPTIQIRFPRGDSDATALDEVPFEFQVEDDFGLSDYGLEYRIGGGEPVRVSLRSADVEGESQGEATGHHALALENLGLEAGDLVTWAAWATDRRPGRQPYEGAGDLYFLQVRPFARRFQEAPSGQAGAEAGASGGGGLLQLQKQVLIATWNLRARLASLDAAGLDRERATILEAELRILHQVEELAHSAESAKAAAALKRLTEELAGAVQALELAKGGIAAQRLTEAEAHERAAYEILLSQGDQVWQVSQVESLSSESRAENPPELEGLELDRNRNFYEQESRTRPPDPEADKALDRLKELAARQELIHEEIARLIAELDRAQSEREREEIRRRLEKLREEIRRSMEQLDELDQDLQRSQMTPGELREAGGRIDEARRQIERSLQALQDESSGSPAAADGLQQARSASHRALEAMEGLEKELQERSSATVHERMQKLQERLAELREGQEEVLSRIGELRGENEGPGLRVSEDADARMEELREQSRRELEKFVETMESAGTLAEAAEGTQPLGARKLGDWLRETSASGIAEDMEGAREALGYSLWDDAQTAQSEVLRKLADAEDGLREVAGLMVKDEADATRLALDQLHELMEAAGMSPGERSRETADAGATQSPAGDSRAADEDADAQRAAGPDGATERETPGARGDKDGTEAPGSKAVEPTVRKSAEGTGPSAQGHSDEAREGQEAQPAAEPDARAAAGTTGKQGLREAPVGREPGAAAESGGSRGAGTRGGFSGPQDWPVDAEAFLTAGYRSWIERLRDAQSALPQGDPVAEQLDAIALQIERMRREFARERHPPKFSLFLEGVARPLHAAASELEDRLRGSARGEDFLFRQTEEVPSQYKQLVAGYFEALTADEGTEHP